MQRAQLLALLLLLLLAFAAPQLALAAPGDVLWVFQGIEDINATVEVPDVDQDGVPEIAVETYDAGAGAGDQLYLLSGGSSGTATVIWSARPPGGVSQGGGDGDDCLNGAPDLNGDGFPDLVRGTAWGGRTAYGINARTGAVLWSFDTYVRTPPVPATSGWVYTVHPIPDLDADQVSDVIFGCGSFNDGAYAVNGRTGDVIYRLNAPDVIYSSTVPGDMNGDGKAEAVFGGGDNDTRVYCVSGASQGTATTLWTANVGSTTWHMAHLPADLDGDTRDEVVAGTWNSSTPQVRCLSGATGAPIWTFSTGSFNYVMRVVPLDDVDGDTVPDLVIASWVNATHVVSGATGAQIWRMEAGTLNGGDVWAVDRVDDVTGDGISDVIAGSFDRKAYLYDGVSGAEVWSVDVGARVFSVRGVSDLSGNGVPDVVVGTQMLSGAGGRLFALEGNDAAAIPRPAPAARPLAAGIELRWETAGFAAGTAFNVYRREIEAGQEDGAVGLDGLRAQKAAIAGAALPARERAELASALTGGDPFTRLNRDPIPLAGAWSTWLDGSARPGVRYEYRIGFASPGSPAERFLEPVEATAAGAPAARLALGVAGPEPSRGTVALRLEVPPGAKADVAVVAVSGRPVRVLARNLAGGETHRLSWDGRDDARRPVAPGVYVVAARSGGDVASRKVVLLP